jgi:hypothetical protein
MTLHYVLAPKTRFEDLGLLTLMLDDSDPRTASQQFDEHYCGGWFPSQGINGTGKMHPTNFTFSYPGDPPLRPIAMTKLRDEIVVFYDHGFVAIFQPDGKWEMARLD